MSVPQRRTNNNRSNRRSRYWQRSRPASSHQDRLNPQPLERSDYQDQISRPAVSHLPSGIQQFLERSSEKLPVEKNTAEKDANPCATLNQDKSSTVRQRNPRLKFKKKSLPETYGGDFWNSKVSNAWSETTDLADIREGSGTNTNEENAIERNNNVVAIEQVNWADEVVSETSPEACQVFSTDPNACENSGGECFREDFVLSDVCDELAKKFGAMWSSNLGNNESHAEGSSAVEYELEEGNYICEDQTTLRINAAFNVNELNSQENVKTDAEVNINEDLNANENFLDCNGNLNINMLPFDNQDGIQAPGICPVDNAGPWGVYSFNSTDFFPVNVGTFVCPIYPEYNQSFETDNCNEFVDVSNQNLTCATEQNDGFLMPGTFSCLQNVPDETYTEYQLVSAPYASYFFNGEPCNQAVQHCEVYSGTILDDQQYKNEVYDVSNTFATAGSDRSSDLEEVVVSSDLHTNDAFGNIADTAERNDNNFVDFEAGRDVDEETHKDEAFKKHELPEIFGAAVCSERSIDLQDELLTSDLHANATFATGCNSGNSWNIGMNENSADQYFEGHLEGNVLNALETTHCEPACSQCDIASFRETNFLDDSFIFDNDPDKFAFQMERKEIENSDTVKASSIDGHSSSAVKFQSGSQNAEVVVKNTNAVSGSDYNCGTIDDQMMVSTCDDKSTVNKICFIIRLEEAESKQLTKRFTDNSHYIVKQEVRVVERSNFELLDGSQTPGLSHLGALEATQKLDKDSDGKSKEENFITRSEGMSKRSENIFGEFLREDKFDDFVKDQAGDYSAGKTTCEVDCDTLSFGSASGDHMIPKKKAIEVTEASRSSPPFKRPGITYRKRLFADKLRDTGENSPGSDLDISVMSLKSDELPEAVRPAISLSSFMASSSSDTSDGFSGTQRKTGKFSKLKGLFSRKK